MSGKLTHTQFHQAVRHALNHLYDPIALSQNPLIELLDLQESPHPSTSLRRTFMNCIDSLKPGREIPSDSRQRRAYDILVFRYLQQVNQQEVAEQLGFSRRHLVREQRYAIELLAERLRVQFDLELSLSQVEKEELEEEGVDKNAGIDSATLETELGWLAGTAANEPARLEASLASVLELVQPLANQHHVELQVEKAVELPAIAVRPDILRQILVSLLSAAIRALAGGTVLLQADATEGNVHFSVQAQAPDNRTPVSIVAESLEVVRYLAENCGGHLATALDRQPFQVSVRLPAFKQIPVLVVDDNQNALSLLQRYVSGTRFRAIGTTDPEKTFDLTAQLSPRLIVLDLMMPEVDGWELLGRLQHHPLTADVPVLVCSILAEEELAFSLGADGYLHKPVSRTEFLAALEGLLQETMD